MSLTKDEDGVQPEEARRLFSQTCSFVAGVAKSDQFPEPSLPEVAFAGRSNVGKSSLLNALTGRRALARTSQSPGHTRQLNFFKLADRLLLVDLPGYGYAKASKAAIAAWTDLTLDYLRGRVTLARVMLLIDARHGIKVADEQVMERLDEAAVVYQIVLTKVDKTKPQELDAIEAGVRASLKKHPAAFPEPIVTSALTGRGIDELRLTLAVLAGERASG